MRFGVDFLWINDIIGMVLRNKYLEPYCIVKWGGEKYTLVVLGNRRSIDLKLCRNVNSKCISIKTQSFEGILAIKTEVFDDTIR